MNIKQILQYGIGYIKAKVNHVKCGKHCYIGLNVKICNSGGGKIMRQCKD